MKIDENLIDLIESVKERNGKPINLHVVIATIESFGIREIDVKNDFGFETISELSKHIFNHLSQAKFIELKNKSQVIAEKKQYKSIAISDYIVGRNKLFVKEYSTGIFHLLPVAIQIVSIIFFGYSLWTYIGFNKLQSTAIVLGVITGLVATGGLVQVIGKQVSFYWYNEDYKMAKRAIYQIIYLGVKVLIVLFIFFFFSNIFIRIYPEIFIGLVFVYAFFIGLLLLTLAPLYTIKQRWVITVSIFSGTIVSLFLHFKTAINIYYSHWIGLTISILIPLIYLHFFFKKIIKSNKGFYNATPRISLAIYRNINYFYYGTAIFIFIFLDRLLAWSSNLNRVLPYAIYYDKNYEIGMDLAILVFFLLAGVLEYSVASFSRRIDYYQRTITYKSFEEFNAKMLKMYYKNTRIFIISAIGIAFLLYLIITKPWGYEEGFDETLSKLSIWVAVVGGFGYLFLTFGMLNVLYLYTLNQSKKPIIFISISFLVNLIIGLFLSRIVSYEYAVFGMFFGSFVFMVLTTKFTIKFFKNLDYFFYAAY